MAKHKLGEIYAELRLKSKDWTDKLNKSKTNIKDFGMVSVKAFALITAAITSVTIALAKITKDTVRYGVAIDRWVKVTGLAGEEISKLNYAIEQEHGNMQQLEKGLFNLNVRLGYAGDGLVSYTRYFDTLGIAYKNNEGNLRNTYDVFLDLIDIMSQGKLSTETLASASQLLGARAAKDLIPFMKLGREEIERLGQEAEALGLVMSTKTAAGMKKVDDSITALKGALKGFRNLIGEKIAPAVQGFTETMVDGFILIRKNLDNLLPSLKNVSNDTEAMGKIGVQTATFIIKAIGSVFKSIEGLKVAYWSLRSAINTITLGIVNSFDLSTRALIKLLRGLIIISNKLPHLSNKFRLTTEDIDNFSIGIKNLKENLGAEIQYNINEGARGIEKYNTICQTQIDILNNLNPEVLHFSDNTREAKEEIEKLNQEVGNSQRILGDWRDAIRDTSRKMEFDFVEVGKTYTGEIGKIEKQTIDLNSVFEEVGGVIIKAFDGGKKSADEFLVSLAKIAMQIALIAAGTAIGGPVGGQIGGMIGGFFDKGGVAIPKGTAPVFAQEGMIVANKPTMSPEKNIFAEKGTEVFMQGEQFTEFLRSMKPNIVIHQAGPTTWVEVLESASQGDIQRLGRLILDRGLKSQEALG